MVFRNLTLSFSGGSVLLLLFLYSGQILSQQSTVSIAIKDGKVESSKQDFPVNSFSNNKPAEIHRTHIINGITIDITTTGTTCDNNINGGLVAVASGGTFPYTYTLSNTWGSSSTLQNGNFPILSAGDYILTVADADGQRATMNITITNTFSSPVLYFSSYNDASGCTTQDASVTLLATGGVPPYEYSMDGINYQANNTFSNLYSGIYYFLVRDANGCIGTISTYYAGYLINPGCSPPIGFSTSTAACTNDGHIVASPSSDVFVYSLDGVNYQPTLDFTNLAPGVHTLYYKNAAGEVFIFAIAMLQACYTTINYITADAACQQNDGKLTVTATNGIAPYTYTLDGINYQTSNVFTGLAPGNYFITVKDANGFTSSLGATVYDRCPAVSLTSTGEICQQNNGTITATATKGASPYQYSIDGVNFQNNNVFNGLTAGTYTVTLKDALGFTSTATITVNTTCSTVIVTATTANSTCGNNNGNITAVASNGTEPYQYSIEGVNFQASNIFTGLAAGAYIITAKDINGQEGIASVTVLNTAGPQISAVPAPALCSNNHGSISITANGGTPPFQYSIDGVSFQNNNQFNNIASGNYNSTIKDANGCIINQPTTVIIDSNLALNAGNDISICEGKEATLPAVSNGSSFIWFPTSGLNDAHLLNPLASPSVTTKYYVSAMLGVCSKMDSIIVTVNPAPVAFAGEDTTICYGQSVQLNGAGGLTYSWTPATYLDDPGIYNPTVISPLASITYHLKVTDGNGCTSLQSTSINITVTPIVKVFAGNDTSIIINQPFELIAKDVNDSGFVQYSWSPSYGLNNSVIQNPETILDRNITYTVSAITESGCRGTDDINIKVYQGPEIYVPTAFSPNNDGCNDILKAIPVGIKEFKYFAVYNRWGQRVFYTSNSGIGWSGEIKSTMQQTDVFVWITEGTDHKGNIIKRKGTVTLIQ